MCQVQIFMKLIEAAADDGFLPHLADPLLPVRAGRDLRLEAAVLHLGPDHLGPVKPLDNQAAVALLHLTQHLLDAAYRPDGIEALHTRAGVLRVLLHADEDQMVSLRGQTCRQHRGLALEVDGDRHLREDQQAPQRHHRQVHRICIFRNLILHFVFHFLISAFSVSVIIL